MPYRIRKIEDIPNWVDCPFCGLYETKCSKTLLRHIRVGCIEYNGDRDLVKEEMLSVDISVGDYIRQMENNIALAEHFIQTNELEALQELPVSDIIKYIVEKIGKPYSGIDMDAIEIYEFFFGECFESRQLYEDIIAGWVANSSSLKNVSGK
jgi:hypothetical protein